MQVEESNKSLNFQHIPVLADEIINSMLHIPSDLIEGGAILDGTIGGGGHASLILEKFSSINLIGLDHDPEARSASKLKLNKFSSRIKIIDSNFSNYEPNQKFCMALFDLGVSSYQLDNLLRGFSFQTDGPIDMRMNPNTKTTAADLMKLYDEKKLADTIFNFGEEKFSRRIARKIKNDIALNGNYSGTKELANAITTCYPYKLRRGRIPPATRTFQALRIAVNNELESLEKLLSNCPDWLLPGGLFCVISFHSLEDRRVKNTFKNDLRLNNLTKKPIRASKLELEKNPRSRSAKLRICQKV